MNKMEGKFGGTDLHTYAKSSSWSKLLAAANPNLLRTLNEHNRTPLHYAIENGAPTDVLVELMRVGPHQVRIRDVQKETPMHLGCEAGMDLVTAYALLDADATAGRGRQSVLAMKNANEKTPLELIRWAKRAKIMGRDMGVAWRYHKDEYEGVLTAVEEAASGSTGSVGAPVMDPAAIAAAAQRRSRVSDGQAASKRTGNIPEVCVAVPWSPPCK